MAGLRPLGHVREHYRGVSLEDTNQLASWTHVEDGVASIQRHRVLHLLLSLRAVRVLRR
jgi:hypothetical protein